MKHRNLSLILALALVVLMSMGIAAHAETTTSNAKKLLLTDGERVFKTDDVNVLEEGWLKANLEINSLDEISEVMYAFDEGSDSESKTILTDEIEERIRIKKEFAIGTVHTLHCMVKYTDGSLREKSYTFKSVTKHKNYDQLCMNVKLNGECMYQEHYYNVKEDDVISVDVETFYEDMPVSFTGYYWADADTWKRLSNYMDFYGDEGNHLEIKVPEEFYGTRKALIVESVLKTNQGSDDDTRRSGWAVYLLNFGDNVGVVTELGDKRLYDTYRYLVRTGDKITVSGIPMLDSKISFIGYYFAEYDKEALKWNQTDIIRVTGGTAEIIVPNRKPGSMMYLYVEPVDVLDDSRASYVTKTGWQRYTLVWCDDTPVEEKETLVSYSGNDLENNSTIEASLGEYLRLSATSAERIEKILFRWDETVTMAVFGVTYYDLEIPSEFSENSTHKLQVRVLYNNGEKSATKTLYITVSSEKDVNSKENLD